MKYTICNVTFCLGLGKKLFTWLGFDAKGSLGDISWFMEPQPC